MTDLKSNILKGLLAAFCSVLAMAAGAAAARQEAQGVQTPRQQAVPVSRPLQAERFSVTARASAATAVAPGP